MRKRNAHADRRSLDDGRHGPAPDTCLEEAGATFKDGRRAQSTPNRVPQAVRKPNERNCTAPLRRPAKSLPVRTESVSRVSGGGGPSGWWSRLMASPDRGGLAASGVELHSPPSLLPCREPATAGSRHRRIPNRGGHGDNQAIQPTGSFTFHRQGQSSGNQILGVARSGLRDCKAARRSPCVAWMNRKIAPTIRIIGENRGTETRPAIGEGTQRSGVLRRFFVPNDRGGTGQRPPQKKKKPSRAGQIRRFFFPLTLR